MWLGHQSESQFQTDDRGRFHLKKVPPGTYQLSVSGPRVENQRSRMPTMVSANAGDMNVEIVVDPRPQPPTPRLQPRRIEPIQPPASQP
jgi:hypothetical protein